MDARPGAVGPPGSAGAGAVPLPGPRGVLATLRTVRGLTADPCPALDRAVAEHGRTFSVGAGPLRMVVVGDPAQLEDLLAEPRDAFRWGHWANVLGFFVGDGSMLVSDGEDHQRLRAQVQPAFARRQLDRLPPMIVAETDRAIDDDLLGAEGVVDLFPIGRRLVLTMVLRALFGRGLHDRVDEVEQLLEPVKEYLEQSLARQTPHPLPGTRRARARAARRQLDRLVDAEVARRRAAASGEASDVLDILLEGAGDDRLSMSEVRDQVRTLIGAGYDTTTSALAWMTLQAAGDPEVWARLRAEADDVLVDEPDASTLARLPYAGAVVREALRLHPPGVLTPRQAVRDVTIGRSTIPAGAMVLWSSYLAGRDPAVWADPLAFRPERHLDGDGPSALEAAAWVPFGRGPRRCIGFGLAQLELTLTMSRIAQRVDLTLAGPATPRPQGMVVNRPTGGVPVVASPRAVPTGSTRQVGR